MTVPDLGWFRAQLAETLADQGPTALLTLSDEEMAALQPVPAGADLVAAPYLDRLSPERRDQSIATAFRSLVARGMAEPVEPTTLEARLRSASADGSEQVEIELRLAADVQLALTLRATADAVLVVDQMTGEDGRLWRYLHLHEGGVCLDEQVDRAGMHTFAVIPTAAAAELVTAMCDPLDQARADAPPKQLDPAAIAAGDQGPMTRLLDGTAVLTQLLLLRADEGTAHGRLHTCYAGPAGVRLTVADPVTDPGTFTLRELGAATLATLIADLVELKP